MAILPATGTTQEQVDDLVLELLPRQGMWGAEQYLWLTDHTNRLIELTDGHIEPLPMPTEQHQFVLLFLYDELKLYVRANVGVVLVAPLRLRIRDNKFREPDILLVRDANDPRRGKRHWLGADLVMEVVSPDNPQRDLVEKRRDYAEARIPEYWIVDPQRETIAVLHLEGDAYIEQGTFGRGDRATSALLTGFVVDVGAVFDAD